MNPIKKLGDLTARLVGARSAIGDLHRTDKELRTMHEGLQAERGLLCGAKPPRTEMFAVVDAHVDALAAEWRAAHGAQIVAAFSTSIDVGPAAAGCVLKPAPGVASVPVFWHPIDVRTLAALVPDQVKASLRRIIEATEFPEGPPMAERPKLLADLDAQIADVEDKHTALVDEARELGITLDLLEPVRSRRAAGAYRAEAAEREARDLARKAR